MWAPTPTAALRSGPFESAAQLIQSTSHVFERVSPACGAEFRTMMAEQLLDLDSRKGKAPGGYCETLHYRGRPFIFMNAVGVLEDVSTLLHEGGHAFHAFAARRQPLIWQRHPGLEMCELASMSMELLASPYLDRQDGGFFDTEDFRRARIEHLEDVLLTLSHVASVDAFQSWLYTSGEGGDRDARDAAWLRIRSRFERGWTGRASNGNEWPAGTASSTSFCTPSTTSSTAWPRSERSRSGGTACRIPAKRCASTARPWRLAQPDRCPSCIRRPERNSPSMSG